MSQKLKETRYSDEKYPHQDLTEKIISAAMDVQRVLGYRFTEAVYQEALEIEFRSRKIPFSSQVELGIEYKGELLRKKFRADFVVDSTVILELKSAKSLTPEDQSQLLNYLSATEFQLGLLLNFGSLKLGIKRMIL